MNRTKARGVGTAGIIVRLTGILGLAIGAMSCASDETVNPAEPPVELTEISSSKGSRWDRKLRIDPDSVITKAGETLQLTAARPWRLKSTGEPAEVDASWFVLGPKLVEIEGSTRSRSTVMLRALQPGNTKIAAVYRGSVAVTRVWVEEGNGDGEPDHDGGQGQPAVAAVLSGPAPVLLVGDTVSVTVRPNLIGEDSVVIPTALSEWSVDFDPTHLAFLSDTIVTALAATPPGSPTAVVLTHRATGFVAEVDLVILLDEDPAEGPSQPGDPGEIPTAPGDWPNNEPAGLTTILAEDGSSKRWSGFSQHNEWNDNSRVTVVNDPDSKHGQAVERRYFIGDADGWHGLTADEQFGPFRELYIRTVFKVSSNWQWHHSGGKYFYYGAAGRAQYVSPTQFVLGWEGGGMPYWTAVGDGRYIAEGVPPSSRGVYHTIEIHHVASTSGANGSLRMWVDGVEVKSFTRKSGFSVARSMVLSSGRQWATTSKLSEKRLGGIQAFMYWGGQGDTKRVNDWIRISEMYISGKY